MEMIKASTLEKPIIEVPQDMNLKEYSPEMLKELRTKKGLSQAEFAKDSGIPIGTIKSWEQGLKKPGYEALLKLGRYFDVHFVADWDGTLERHHQQSGNQD